jgi:hypothetical protein
VTELTKSHLIELYKLAAVLDELTQDSRAAGREIIGR